MLSEVGFLATFLAFLSAVYAIGASVYGAVKRLDRWVASARNAALATFPLLVIGTGALLVALITEQYQNYYVWSVTNPETPLLYRITALWGSQSGSLLFWSFLMSGFAAGALVFNWRSQRRLMPYVIAYTMATLAFFLGLTVFIENPFERYWIMPSNDVIRSVFIPAGAVAPSVARLAETAKGLNPLLRHFGMAFHPTTLYLGFVGFVIPFAFAMAALASGDLSTGWIKATRRWSLVAWLFLALGLIIGGRWAYDVLGWGGYWGWDPVENAAFLPWLVGTAFLHSVMIQEKRGMLKVWNMFLVIGTFSAMIFGTFATRSGLIDSVHSFSQSPIGFPMFFFWAIMTLISVALIIWRWQRGELKSDRKFVSLFSREALFVLNNVVFVLLFIAVFWGSFGAPVISELFADTKITIGKEYFVSVTPPLFVALYILMGVAPLSAWGAASIQRLGKALLVPFALTLVLLAFFALTGMGDVGALFGYGVVALAGSVAIYETYRGVMARRHGLGENWWQATTALFARNRRRYGGYIIHLGITVIGLGVIASTLFQQQTQQTLAVGESLELGGYTMTFDSFNPGQVAQDGRIMDVAQVSVSRNGQTLAHLRPRRDFFPETEGLNTITIASAHSTVVNDFYVLLVGWKTMDATSATFKVYLNPLINLVWWGGLVLIFGTFIVAWPKDPAPITLPTQARASGHAGAVA
jgi:cytochrome c-type biogenesis protein CcmF